MLKSGIVEPSDSPYAAPIVLIKKKDQSLRICLDFRDLNKQTIFDPVLMPRNSHVSLKIPISSINESANSSNPSKTLSIIRRKWLLN
jgi:putative transposase